MKKHFKLTILFILVLYVVACSSEEKNYHKTDTPGFSIRTDTLATGLQNPWGLEFLPDGRILIVERPGRVRVWENGVLHSDPLAGFPAVFAHGQGGLLDVVMHPDYDQNGWLYFAYSAPGEEGGNTTVSRARLQGHQLVDFEQLFQGQPMSSSGAHFGSRIVFDKDNYLFTTIGDRGSQNTAQDLSNHNGTVMRIHDDGRVPADNPFVNHPGAMPEIWSYGHRNIQGMVFDPETGDLWTHEHGPRGGDEINVVLRGENYGWPLATFGINYSGTIVSPDTSLPGMIDPILQWTPSIAPCGLDIITSDKYPGWEGNLMVGALAGQHIQRVVIDGHNVVHTQNLLQGFARFRAIRQGPDGLLYALTETPGLFIRLTPVSE